MRHRKVACLSTSYLLIVGMAASFSACSVSDAAYVLKSDTEKQAILYDSPRFWEDTTPVSGSSCLYKLHNVAFEGKPYNDMLSFGDNILMVGQGNYTSSLIDSENQTVEYSFDIYDPWSNEITQSLDHSDVSCDSYEIRDDELWLIDSSSSHAFIYDEELHELRTENYDINSDAYYDSSHAADEYTSVSGADEYYNSYLLDESYDQKYALYSGVDSKTFRYSIFMVDESDNSVVTSTNDISYSSCEVNSFGFITLSDYTNNIWHYHSSDSTDSFFTLKDVYSLGLVDDSIIMRTESAISEGSIDGQNQTFSCYQYMPSEGVTSSFTYDLGTYGTDDFEFLSTESIYLEEADCFMILTYTKQLNPEILVWQLGDGLNTTDTTINSYDSSDDVLEAMKADGTYTSYYDENYGSDVCALDDSANYDWGELAPLKDRISLLEEKYSFTMYFGPEVPSQIDIYSVKKEEDADKISDALDMLETILALYPDDFFNQLSYDDIRGTRIYLGGAITTSDSSSIEEASGFVNTINNYNVMVLDCNYSWDWAYTVNHEISHMIDQRLSFVSTYIDTNYSDLNWGKYNPNGFEYENSYSEYDPYNFDSWKEKYFIDSYGTTFATEDRAEIFGTMMDNYINGIDDDSRYSSSCAIGQKMMYYAKCIRECFDTTSWPEELPWEI